MPLSVEAVEAAVVGSGFAVVERDTSGPFGSWYLMLDHEPRLRASVSESLGLFAPTHECLSMFGEQVRGRLVLQDSPTLVAAVLPRASFAHSRAADVTRASAGIDEADGRQPTRGCEG